MVDCAGWRVGVGVGGCVVNERGRRGVEEEVGGRRDVEEDEEEEMGGC